MTAHPDIFDAALGLPLDERGELISKLIVSLEDEPFDDPDVVEAERNAEIDRRIVDIDSGKTVGIPLGEVSRVEAGEEIVISRDCHPVAKVVRLDSSVRRSRRGSLRGKITFADDWDSMETNEAIARDLGMACWRYC